MKKTIMCLMLSCATFMAHAQKEDKELAKQAKEAYKAAEDAYKKKDLKSAADQVEKSFQSEKYKNDEKAWMFRGDIYGDLALADSASGNDAAMAKNLEEATKSYSKTVELNKNYGVLYIDGKVQGLYAKFFNWGVSAYQNDNDYVRAAKNFEYAGQLKPQDTLAVFYSLIAYQLQDNKDYTKIENLANKAISLGLKDPSPYYALLDKYMNVEEKYDVAEKIMKEARAKHPTDKNLMMNQINLYLKTNKTKEAIADLEQAAANTADPKEKFPLVLNLGILYENTAQFDKAEQQYKAALAMQPDNPDAIYSLGALFYNKGVNVKKEADQMNIDDYNKRGKEIIERAKVHFREALPYFQKSIKNKPTSLEMLNALRSIYTVDEKPLEAVPYYKAALEKEPDNMDVLQGLITVCQSAKNMDAAMPFIQALAPKKALDPDFLNMLFDVYKGANRLKEAEPYFASAAKALPDNVDVLENYSFILYSLKKNKEADAVEKQIEKLNKKN